jgi:hypothetical protein
MTAPDEATKAATEAGLWTTEIRPGVVFPDWSAVSSELVRTALSDIFEAFGMERCWDGLSAEEDRVRRAVLEGYLGEGRPPTAAALAASTGLGADAVTSLLAGLRKRDLIVLGDSGEIRGAYPLTETATEHRVRLGDHVVHAMCAIDALGVGRMYESDVVIDSSCRASARPIRIVTAGHGRRLRSVEPASAVVWSGIRLSEGCAAETLCTVIAFFETAEALESWRERENPDARGYRLTVEEGMQAGMAIFAPMLAPGGPAA